MKPDPKVVPYPAELARRDAQPRDEADGDLITLRELFSKVWRGRWIIALTSLGFLALALVAVAQMGTRYKASASVMFGAPKANVIDLQEILADPEFSKDTLQNEIEVLRSTSLIERVVAELDLADNPEFNPDLRARPPGLAARLRATLRLPPPLNDLLIAYGLAAPPAPPAGAAERALRRRLTIIDRVLNGLTLRPIEGTRVIEISFTSGDPRTAAAIVNTFADQYIVDQLVAKLQTTRSGIHWLTGRVDEARQQVQAAEEAVEALRARLSESAGQSLEITEQQLVALNASLPAAHAETAEIAAQYQRLTEALRSDQDMGAITEFRDSPVIRAYRDAENALLGRLDSMSPNHPELPRLEAQLSELRAKIRAEGERTASAVRIELDAARARTASLAAALRELETKALAQSRAQVELRQLEREAEASRAIYETMLNRLKETSEQVELQAANARVLSPADPPLAPESSRKRLIVAMAATLGLIAGAGLVFLRDQLNNTFRGPRQIEEVTGLPVLAMVPGIGARRDRADVIAQLREKPNSSLAEAVRNLRTSILFSNVDQPPRVVMFTSSVPGEGKSTTAMLTALTSRQMGKSAIIVDCDLRQPTAGRTLRAENPAGLLSVLDGTATLDDAVHIDPDTGLHVLVAQPREHSAAVNAADVLASNRFQDLIRDLSQRYDLVVLDTPPTLVVADARILAGIADAVVYAVRWDSTARGAVLEGLRELASVKAAIAGIVLTMVNEARASRYSVDGYTYYRGRYRDYYVEKPIRLGAARAGARRET